MSRNSFPPSLVANLQQALTSRNNNTLPQNHEPDIAESTTELTQPDESLPSEVESKPVFRVRNALPASLVANLQQALTSRNNNHEPLITDLATEFTHSNEQQPPEAESKPTIRVRNALPASLVANLQQVLTSRMNNNNNNNNSSPPPPKDDDDDDDGEQENVPESLTELTQSNDANSEENSSKPVVLVTNADGIESPGIVSLVYALVRDGCFDVHVCAPQFDKSASAHSLTVSETIEVSSAEISGATSFEVSGTPADCVSLALSQTLFSWSKPVLVISGINRGSSCGQNMLSSGAIAGAREALICGVASLCISLDWKNEVSSENDFKEAVEVCLPLIKSAIRDIEKGIFPKSCLLNIEVPVSPSAHKGFKLTRQSLWRSGLTWRSVSSYKHPSAMNVMAIQQSLGIQLAQLGRDASAAGAARRLHKNKQNVEVVSVGVAGKQISEQTIRKHYRLEFLNEEKEDADEDLDFKALQSGFVAITPVALSSELQPEIHSSVLNWLSLTLAGEQ